MDVRSPSPGRGPEPGGSPADPLLYRKLSWLTLFRLATVTILLGVTAVTDLAWSGRVAEGPGPLYAVILVTYACSLGFALALRARWRLRPLAYAQIALDVGIAAVVVALSGGTESVFVFLFSLAVVNGSILLFRRGALVSLALAAGGYLLVALPGGPRGASALALFVHTGAFAVTAALAGYLAEQLRSTGEQLAAREGDLAAITALHEAIVQSVTSGLVTMDTEGRITFLNGAGEQIMGRTAAELSGQPGDRYLQAFQAGSGRDETTYVNARGEQLILGYNRFPLATRAGKPVGSAVIFQDLTRLRDMEEQVERGERLADLGRLAAGLAHELRNPLASMSGSIELLKATAVREEDARLMDIVLREAARLDQLVSRFLAFSRPEPPRRTHVDLAVLARETLEVFAHDPSAAQVEVIPELAPTAAWCDPDQVRQVLWNLLHNAAQAAGQREGRGRVGVRVAAEADGAVLLTVDDDGPGIAPDDLPHLFTPFFTTREKGTGLGLAVVQRIVDGHGGRVAVGAAPWGGARFLVRLPPRPPAAG